MKIIIPSLFLVLLFFSNYSKAALGCDTCTTNAVNAAKQLIDAQLSNVNTSLEQLNKSIKDMDSTIKDSGDNLQKTLDTFSEELKRKFEQAAMTTSASINKSSTDVATVMDSEITKLKGEFKRLAEASKTLSVDFYNSSKSIPMSHYESSSQAIVLPEAIESRDLFIKDKIENFRGWQDGGGYVWMSNSVNRKKAYEFIEENKNLLYSINNPLITLENAHKLSELYKFLLVKNPQPEEGEASSVSSANELIELKRAKLRDLMAFTTYIESLADKIPLINREKWANVEVTGWGDVISVVTDDGVNRTSFEIMNKYNTTDKATSILSAADITDKYHTAALREQALQTVRQNTLVLELIKIEERALLLDLMNKL